MRTRLGLFIGGSLGYYFGAKAGRQRYEQLNRLIGKAKRSKTADIAQDRARAVAEVAAERAKETASAAKDKVKDKMNHNDDGQPSTISPS